MTSQSCFLSGIQSQAIAIQQNPSALGMVSYGPLITLSVESYCFEKGFPL
jgi:hypothetical protein